MQTTMVNAAKRNILPLPAGRYGKSTNCSTRQRHKTNEGKSGLQVERVQALWVLHSFEFQKEACGGETTRNTLLKQ
jgi:hypothetical protein